jgi:hypothetical protein
MAHNNIARYRANYQDEIDSTAPRRYLGRTAARVGWRSRILG